MAYMQSIVFGCQDCGNRAGREVFNNLNASIGVYCVPCANRQMRILKEKEKKERKDVPNQI